MGGPGTGNADRVGLGPLVGVGLAIGQGHGPGVGVEKKIIVGERVAAEIRAVAGRYPVEWRATLPPPD